MSLQTRLSAFITAVGADVKALKTTLKILDGGTSLADFEQPLSAVEWRYGGGSGNNLTGKLATISPIVSAVIVNRSELWARVKSRDGTLSADRLILDSDGKSDFHLGAQPRCRASRATTTAAFNGSGSNPTVLTYNVENYDTETLNDATSNGMVDLSKSTSKIFIKRAGLYLFHADLQPNSGPSGGYRFVFRVNGVAAYYGSGLGNLAGFWEGSTASAQLLLNAGDYVEVLGFNSNATGFQYSIQTYAVRLSA